MTNFSKALSSTPVQAESLLVNRIVEAAHPQSATVYEKRLHELEREKCQVAEKLKTRKKRPHRKGELFELSTRFFSRPWEI